MLELLKFVILLLAEKMWEEKLLKLWISKLNNIGAKETGTLID